MNSHLRVALATLVITAAAFGYTGVVTLEMSSPWSTFWVENFHDIEGDYRWTRARSTAQLPYLGSGREGRLEIQISSFRPRTQPAPRSVIEVGGQNIRLSPRALTRESLTLETPASPWGEGPRVLFRSEIFTPGDYDRRPLGVRVHRLRFVPDRGFSIQFPPIRGWLLVWLSAASILVAARASGLRDPWAERVALAGVFAWGLAIAFARLPAWTLLPPVAVVCGIAALTGRFAPAACRAAFQRLERAGGFLVDASRALLAPTTLGLVLAAAIGTVAVYRVVDRIEVTLGPGKEAWVAERFAGPDSIDGVTFRTAQRDARIRMPDHGSGSWTIGIEASVAGEPQRLELARAGGSRLDAELSQAWSEYSFEAEIAAGWASGPILEFPEAAGRELRVRRVVLDRASSWPSGRLLLTVVGIALFSGTLATVCGLGAARRLGIALGATALSLAFLGGDPLLGPRLLQMLLLGLAAAIAGIAMVRAGGNRSETFSPATLVIVGLGAVCWFASMLYPLYVGGHFGFHSNIAAEIWQGRFLHYYLPEPGSMLSRQPQWGNVVVPHSCLYHTLVAPLAALPPFWFASTQKLALAGLLAATALAAARTTRVLVEGDKASVEVFTALAAVAIPISYQLVGLGHLMTLFGVFAGSLSMGFLIRHIERLGESPIWWRALLWLVFCFVSYTASLLFGLTILFMLVAVSAARGREIRPLVGLILAASASSLVLYYGNWVWPFLSESVPSLLNREIGGAEGSAEWLSRIGDIPRRLSYSFGSVWIPVLGLVGVGIAPSSRAKTVLVAWSYILPLFVLADLMFNFLLKHHYFTFPAIAIGLGILAERLWSRGLIGKVAVAVGLLFMARLGLEQAVAVATGVVGTM